MRSLSVLSCAALTLAPAAAIAAPGCAKMTVRSTAAQRHADAGLVTRVGRQHVTTAQVGEALADGPWRFVWATPSDAERGVFFFHKDAKRGYRLMETWGGVIAPEERSDTIRWVEARRGHPPHRLAVCFVDAVIAGN